MSLRNVLIMSAASILVMVVFGIQRHRINMLTEERDIYRSNTSALMADIEQLKNDSTGKAYQIEQLSLSVQEYQKYRAADLAMIEDLNVRISQLVSASKQEMEIDASISAPIQQDTVLQCGQPTLVQTVKYHDKYLQFDATITNDSVAAKINIPITLQQIVYRVPKYKFLWWTWGTKAIRQVITTDNIYATIKYSEYIELRQ